MAQAGGSKLVGWLVVLAVVAVLVALVLTHAPWVSWVGVAALGVAALLAAGLVEQVRKQVVAQLPDDLQVEPGGADPRLGSLDPLAAEIAALGFRRLDPVIAHLGGAGLVVPLVDAKGETYATVEVGAAEGSRPTFELATPVQGLGRRLLVTSPDAALAILPPPSAMALQVFPGEGPKACLERHKEALGRLSAAGVAPAPVGVSQLFELQRELAKARKAELAAGSFGRTARWVFRVLARRPANLGPVRAG